MGSIIALSGESRGNHPESSLGRAEPAGLNGIQALLCSAPSAQAAIILAAGFIGAGMRQAGAACASRRGPAGPRLRAGPAERGWGRRGRAETPPLRAGEVLFLGSRAGATPLPAPSAPACKSGGDDKWRRGIWAGSRRRCRAGAVFSLGRVIPSTAATLRSRGAAARARGGWSWGHRITRSAWGRQNWGTGPQPAGDGRAAAGLAVGAQCGARRCGGHCSGAGRTVSGAWAGAAAAAAR